MRANFRYWILTKRHVMVSFGLSSSIRAESAIVTPTFSGSYLLFWFRDGDSEMLILLLLFRVGGVALGSWDEFRLLFREVGGDVGGGEDVLRGSRISGSEVGGSLGFLSEYGPRLWRSSDQ